VNKVGDAKPLPDVRKASMNAVNSAYLLAREAIDTGANKPHVL